MNDQTRQAPQVEAPGDWQMDQDGPIDWALDVPIPFRCAGPDHERGDSIDEVRSEGFVS